MVYAVDLKSIASACGFESHRSIYDNGAKAAMGNFAAFSAIPGVEVRTVFFDPVNSLVSGSMTEQQWIDGIKSASDQMRANIIE